MKKLVYILFLIPLLGLSQSNNAPSTYVSTWANAGVSGGIIERTSIYATVTDVTNLQSTMDTCSSLGGGVVLLSEAVHDVSSLSTLYIPLNVTLRGVGLNTVIYSDEFITGTGGYLGYAKYLVQLDGNYSGLENITIQWAGPCDFTTEKNPDTHFWRGDDTGMCLTYADYCALTGDTTNDPCDTGNGFPDLAYRINGVNIDSDVENSWIKNVYVENSGSWPIRIRGDNNTVQDCVINGAYLTGGGGNGYFLISGSNNLIINNWMKRFRHFNIENDGGSGGTAPTENVIVGNIMEVDYNLHNADGGGQLFTRNSVFLSDTHLFIPIQTGSEGSGHDPPGPDNYIYKNTGVWTNVGYGEEYEEMLPDFENVYYMNGTYSGDYAVTGPQAVDSITDANPAYIPSSGEFYSLPSGLKKKVLVYYDLNSLGNDNDDASQGDIYRTAIASYVNSIAKDYDVHIAHDVLGSDITNIEQINDFYNSVLIVTTDESGVNSGIINNLNTWKSDDFNRHYEYVDPSESSATYESQINVFMARHDFTDGTVSTIQKKRARQQGILMFMN